MLFGFLILMKVELMIRVFVISCMLLFFGSAQGFAEEVKSDAKSNSNALNLEAKENCLPLV